MCNLVQNHNLLFIIAHQTTNDIHTLKPLLIEFEHQYESLPENLTADAGYGSEENYEFLEQTRVEGYVKYNTFDKEQQSYKSKKKAKDDFHRDTSHYNEKEDYYVCTMGQRMNKIYDKKRTTKSGYTQISSVYQA